MNDLAGCTSPLTCHPHPFHQMCSRHLRRTEPAGSRSEPMAAVIRARRNGWTWPMETLQKLTWFTYIYFLTIGFGIYIPLLPFSWDLVAYCLIGSLFTVHIGTHIAAMSIDPAEPNVRAKKYSTPLPPFAKDKHAHVIVDGYCTICEVEVRPEAKHCRRCNKCITGFDHHCKFLNNCVGKRNYWVFFVAVLTAVIGMTLLILVIFIVCIEHFLNPAILRTAPQFQSVNNSTWLLFLPLAPVKTSSAVLLAVTIFSLLLGLAALMFLIHLLVFHFYLLYNNITTYDYIKEIRAARKNQDVESGLKQSRPTSKASAKKEPSLEAVVCESPLPSQTSVEEDEESQDLATRLSVAVSTELMRLQTLSTIHYFSTMLAHSLPDRVTCDESLSWTGLQEVVVAGDQASDRSVEGTPVLQNPLGSYVMSTTAVEQQQDNHTRSESALSQQ